MKYCSLSDCSIFFLLKNLWLLKILTLILNHFEHVWATYIFCVFYIQFYHDFISTTKLKNRASKRLQYYTVLVKILLYCFHVHKLSGSSLWLTHSQFWNHYRDKLLIIFHSDQESFLGQAEDLMLYREKEYISRKFRFYF